MEVNASDNQLVRDQSPYLLQHKDNPVHWMPWGREAFSRAAQEDKPILLSIGYAACHWCHVMAHESFEDRETAELMNRNFISVKVDREERPDVDAVYMDAVQAIAGRGGWPMTVFLAPDGRPFFGGTYYPKPSFLQLLSAVDDAWRTRRDELLDQAGKLTEDRLESYRKLVRELAYLERRRDARAQADEKRRWKQLNKEMRGVSRTDR